MLDIKARFVLKTKILVLKTKILVLKTKVLVQELRRFDVPPMAFNVCAAYFGAFFIRNKRNNEHSAL
jgi:hypothetical protein